MKNPIILESGPFAHDGISIRRAAERGFGAVATETVSLRDGASPRWHLMGQGESMLNCSYWSDLPVEQWLEQEIPIMSTSGCASILSLGHSLEEIEKLVPLFSKSPVSGFKMVSYRPDDMAQMVRFAKAHTDKPVWAKVSPNWEDPVRIAVDCVQNGADAIVAIDTYGPVSVQVQPGGVFACDGAWISGTAIHALALQIVSEICSNVQVDVIGVGGIQDAASLGRMSAAGATGFGVCTAVIRNGLGVIDSLLEGLPVSEKNPGSIEKQFGPLPLQIDTDRCTECGLCIETCGYRGWQITEKGIMHMERCRGCGWCIQQCPVDAISL